jgi:aspartate/methionine/tyrosine aminotransferase
LREALMASGFSIDASHAGLYLWASRGEESWDTLAWLADRGIVAAPGTFYGAAGSRHVRVALTASDAAAEQAASRLVNAR